MEIVLKEEEEEEEKGKNKIKAQLQFADKKNDDSNDAEQTMLKEKQDRKL